MSRNSKPPTVLSSFLDRSGCIGKGQVSGFVNFMRSDLDLATKTECMEAIRLTEGKANRLLRFVKSGGVTKIVMWLERALREPSSTVNLFIDHSLKSLRVLPLRAMEKSAAQCLVDLIRKLRQRLQEPAPRPPTTAPRTPPKRQRRRAKSTDAPVPVQSKVAAPEPTQAPRTPPLQATGFVASAKLIAAPSTPPLPDSIQPEVASAAVPTEAAAGFAPWKRL
mmetsp:Transcript_83444/g.200213  ORF Transcript_83444/g.200213 Transcript_83444/m.200213 type:complete len:222 (-) Transcript_83444:7-672(-)